MKNKLEKQTNENDEIEISTTRISKEDNTLEENILKKKENKSRRGHSNDQEYKNKLIKLIQNSTKTK